MQLHSETAESYGNNVFFGTSERITCVTPNTHNILEVDGLSPRSPCREYKKTKSLTKEKGPHKIGTFKNDKVSLQCVSKDLQSSTCSRGCLAKLKAENVLMNRYRVWGV